MQVARPGHQVSRRRHLRRRRRRRLDYWFSFRRRQQQKRRPPHFPFFLSPSPPFVHSVFTLFRGVSVWSPLPPSPRRFTTLHKQASPRVLLWFVTSEHLNARWHGLFFLMTITSRALENLTCNCLSRVSLEYL